jgi:hypothetical protein
LVYLSDGRNFVPVVAHDPQRWNVLIVVLLATCLDLVVALQTLIKIGFF